MIVEIRYYDKLVRVEVLLTPDFILADKWIRCRLPNGSSKPIPFEAFKTADLPAIIEAAKPKK